TLSEARVEEEMGYSKKRPFQAPLASTTKLNSELSAKDTRHVAFSLAGSGIHYEVGDALGVFVENCPAVVASIINANKWNAAATVPLPDGGQAPLSEALQKHYE